jgi:hypothetical protein
MASSTATVNLQFLKAICPYLADGMYEVADPALQSYARYLQIFQAQLDLRPADAQREFLQGLRQLLSAIFLHPPQEDLEEWFYENALHYPPDGKSVQDILRVVWVHFFGEAPYEAIAENVEYVTEEIDF